MIEFSLPWFFLLLPLPIIIYWLSPAYKESQESVRVPFFQRLVELTGETPQKGAVVASRRPFQKIWISCTWALIICAMAKPMWLGEPIEHVKSARDLMIAVDLSGSMEAKDFVSQDGTELSRLDAVKSVLTEFAEQRQHDRLGLIVFGDSPYLQAPFTQDHKTWLALLNETEIAMAGQSTMFGDAIGLAIKLFDKSETDNRVLIVLTDGNDTGSKVPPVEAAKIADHKGITIYTIAIGDPETVGEQALDMEVIETVAKETGGAAYQALDRDELDRIYEDIAKLEPQDYKTLNFRPKSSLHHYPLALAFIVYLLYFLAKSLMRAKTNGRGLTTNV